MTETGPKRATVYDVAARAGVSIATVSFAFRRPTSVRPQTRQRVLDAARELGYAPSGAARGLAAGRTGVFGLHSFDMILDHDQVAPDARAAGPDWLEGDSAELSFVELGDDAWPDPRAYPLYVDEVQRGFELESRRLGRAVLLSAGSSAETEVADTAGRVDGLAVFPTSTAAASLASISRTVPVVLLSSNGGSDDYHRVTVDNAGGMCALIAHLVDEHRITDIGHVGDFGFDEASERFRGMQQALAQRGIAPPGESLDPSRLDAPDALVRLTRLAADRMLPRALVCSNDQIALAAMDIITAAGLRIPEDVVITGFDGVLAGRLANPTLTTVRQPMEAMGRVAARLLDRECERPSQTARTVRLGTRLVIGRSCGCR